MVTVKSAVVRIGKDGKAFNVLELMGDIELVQSQNTGRFYATARRCFISSTFDLDTAKLFVGKQLPGNIVREATQSYEFIVPETGEEIVLSHTWVYQPDELKHNEEKGKALAISEEDEYDKMVAQIQGTV
jgi:hypothetical protein